MCIAIALCLACCVAGYKCQPSDSNQVNANVSQNVANPIQSNDQMPVQTGNTTSAPSTSTMTMIPTAPGRPKRSNQVEVNANQNIGVVNDEVNAGNATNVPSTTNTSTTTSAFPVGRRKRSHGRHSTPCDSSDDNEADSNEVY